MVKTKDELIDKLRSYALTPDDNNVRYKQLIRDNLFQCPELLFALNNSELTHELFDDENNIAVDGEWDRYFGENSTIRPYILFPGTITDTRNYLCYTVGFDNVPKYDRIYCYTHITFTIFVHENNPTDPYSGIARHDLIASIIRERFNWSSIFGIQTKLISSKEQSTDNHYVVRTLVFQIDDINSISMTPYGEDTRIIDHEVWS